MYIKKVIKAEEEGNVIIKTPYGYRVGFQEDAILYATVTDKELVEVKAGNGPAFDEITEMIGDKGLSLQQLKTFMEDSANVISVHTKLSTPIPDGLYKAVTIDHRDYLQEFESYKKLEKRHGTNTILPIVKQHFSKKSKNTGMLLYGPPGNGKTTDILELTELAKELNLLCIITNSIEKIEDFRRFTQERNVVIILEEISTAVSDKREIRQLLNQLDGIDSFKRCLTVMTTNSIENFPDNIVDRPGRIKYVIKYGHPTKEEIKEIAEMCCVTSDVSILYNKQLSRDYVMTIFNDSAETGQDVETVFKEFKKQRDLVSESFKSKVGL